MKPILGYAIRLADLPDRSGRGVFLKRPDGERMILACGDDAVVVMREVQLQGFPDARIRPTRTRQPNTSVAVAVDGDLS